MQTFHHDFSQHQTGATRVLDLQIHYRGDK